jgi:peptide-methionine (S)-S-oxide reductase
LIAVFDLRSSNKFGRPIATRIETGAFEVADSDQQDFIRKHPQAPSIVVNDPPKLDELRRRYPQFRRS